MRANPTMTFQRPMASMTKIEDAGMIEPPTLMA
jgi:hypothetical protein